MNVGGSESVGTTRFWGLASGLDIDDIVGKLMSAERIPMERLQQRRQQLEWQREDYRSLNMKLKELDRVALSIRLSASLNPSSVTSNNPELIQATAKPGAAEGTYTMQVEQLADAAYFHSKELASTDVTGVSFKIEKTGANPVSKTFTFDSGNIQHVVTQINDAGLDLQAFYDTDLKRLFITGKGTGTSTEYRFTDIDGAFLTSQLGLMQATDGGDVAVDGTGTTGYTGKDAYFTLNGVSGLTKPSNEFELNGISFNLHASSTTPVTIQVRRDTEAIISTIKGFIDMYNGLIDTLNAKLTEKRYFDYLPLTDAQKKAMSERDIGKWEEKARSGLLRSDPVLTQVLSDMRVALTRPVEGMGTGYDMLASIGIKTGPWFENGKLNLDEAVLRKALAADADSVVALFTKTGVSTAEQGVGIRFGEALKVAAEKLGTKAGNANMPVDNSPLGLQMQALDKQIKTMEERLKRREEAHYRQFSALESFMSQMNMQASWLGQQFGGQG